MTNLWLFMFAETLMLVALMLTAALTGQDIEMVGGGGDETPPWEQGGSLPFEDQVVYALDPVPEEFDPQFTVRLGTRYTSQPAGWGNVTFTLTGSARISVSIFGSTRSAILGAGTRYTGRDRNNNGIPDDLDRREIQISPL